MPVQTVSAPFWPSLDSGDTVFVTVYCHDNYHEEDANSEIELEARVNMMHKDVPVKQVRLVNPTIANVGGIVN